MLVEVIILEILEKKITDRNMPVFAKENIPVELRYLR